MNSLIKSATIIDKNSEFHNKSVDILIKNGIISDIAENIKNSKNYSEISFPNLHVSNGWFDYTISLLKSIINNYKNNSELFYHESIN